ncbi:MAG: fibronectin type III domain-containing protein [Elusimicrobia bacterium]|nr:fibronectin type III domain-containing protein [Elusimicrobiota bacterium]
MPRASRVVISSFLACAASLVGVAGAQAQCLASSPAWRNSPLAPQTAPFTASFDAIPGMARMDGLTSLSFGNVSNLSNMAVIVRFNNAGFIDARNDGAYGASVQVPYSPGLKYHFRLVIDPKAHRYSIYVTPPAATELALGSNFAFRSEQAALSTLNNWALWASAGSHQVCAFALGGVGPAPDTTPPAVSISAPASGASVSGTMTVSATATDNVGIAGVQFLIDGAALGAEDTSAPFSASWNTTLALNGTHSLTATARDEAGNRATSSPVVISVNNVVADTTPPVLNAVASTGVTPTGTTVSWTTNEASDSQVEYGPTAAYGSGTAVNAALVTAHSVPLSGLQSSTLYHYRVKSKDAAGNLAISGDFTFTTPVGAGCVVSAAAWQNISFAPQGGSFEARFDATPSMANMDGVIGLSNAAASNYLNVAAIVRFSNAGMIEARNGGLYAAANAIPYTAGTSYRFRLSVNIPNHTFSAYVTPSGSTEKLIGSDYAFRSEQSTTTSLNNLAAFASTGSETVCNVSVTGVTPPADTIPPTVSITAPASGASVAGTVPVSGTAADNVGVAGVQFRLDGAALGAEATQPPYAITWNAGGSSSGTHTLTAVARDAAGNNATSAGVTVTVGGTAPPPNAKNVKNFGAKGDGVTDDTAAIQAALDSVKIGGGTVYIPAGTYIVSPIGKTNALVVYSNMLITGDGPTSVIKVIANAGNYRSIFGSDRSYNATYVENVTFSKFRVNQNPAANTTCDIRTDGVISLPQFVIHLAQFKNATVEDMTFDLITGINTVALSGPNTSNAVVQRNYFKFVRSRSTGSYPYDNSAIYVESHNHKLLNNTCVADIAQKAYGCMETHGGAPSLVEGNNTDGYETGVNIVGFSSEMVASNDIVVRNNNFLRANFAIRTWSISPYNLKGVQIYNNTVTLAQRDFAAGSSIGINMVWSNESVGLQSNIAISSNSITFQDETTSPATITSATSTEGIGLTPIGTIDGVTVTGNTITLAPTMGIHIGTRGAGSSARNITVTGNTIINSGQNKTPPSGYRSYVMLEGNLVNVHVDGNILRDTGTPAPIGYQSVWAQPASATGTTFRNNTITSASGHLIYNLNTSMIDDTGTTGK